MMDAIKYIGLTGEFKPDKMYYFFKTSSSEINLEILSRLQEYESSIDFFSRHTALDINNIINSVNQLDKNLNSIFNDTPNNFSSDMDKYISGISKVIFILSLTIKIQVSLNNNLLKSKQYLNEISKSCKIENIYQGELLSLINNLEYNFANDTSILNNNFSVSSTKANSCSSINPYNKNFSNILSETDNNKSQEDFFKEKRLSIVNEEILSDIQTPEFIAKKPIKDNIYTIINNSSDSASNDNDFNLTFRDMICILDADSKTNNNTPVGRKSKYKAEKSENKNTLSFKKNNNNIRRSARLNRELLNNKSLNEEDEIKMYTDFLLLIKKLYKACLITAEEKIEIKKLIISKSEKLINFYKKEFNNIKDDCLKSANAIKSLL